MKKANYIILAVSLVFVLSCHTKQKDVEYSNNQGKFLTKKNSASQKTTLLVEYKRRPVIDQFDTLPYPNTYILLKKDSVAYYRKGKLFYRDILIKTDKQDIFKFNERRDDLLFLFKKENKIIEIHWLKDSFEGDYEYFRVEK